MKVEITHHDREYQLKISHTCPHCGQPIQLVPEIYACGVVGVKCDCEIGSIEIHLGCGREIPVVHQGPDNPIIELGITDIHYEKWEFHKRMSEAPPKHFRARLEHNSIRFPIETSLKWGSLTMVIS